MSEENLDQPSAFKYVPKTETTSTVPAPSELAAPKGSVSWSVETMAIINRLTPDIKGKAFDPDWFLLRQRLEAIENCLKSIVDHVDEGGTINDSRLDALRFIEPAKAILNPQNNQEQPQRKYGSK